MSASEDDREPNRAGDPARRGHAYAPRATRGVFEIVNVALSVVPSGEYVTPLQ